MSGLELLDMLARCGGGAPVVMITGHGDIPTAVRAIKVGATEFIEKPYTADEILNAVSAAVALPDDSAPTESEPGTEFLRRLDDLTPRQRETFELIVEGHTNASAALCLGISPRTVEAHRARIMEKTGATSLAELVRRSIEIAP